MNDSNSLTRAVISLVLLGVGIGGFLLMGTPEVPKRPPQENAPLVVQTAIAADRTRCAALILQDCQVS